MSISKSTLAIYRDCMRLIDHMAGRSAKATRVRDIVRSEFRKHSLETEPEKIETLRNGAIQGLANYLTVDSVSKLKRKQFSETNTAVSGSGASANSDGSNTQQQ